MSAVSLTPRMKNWLEGLGAHIATATKDGSPTVTVTYNCQVKDNIVTFSLTDAQVKQIKDNIAKNPWVAIGPGQLGVVRAPYQFKGHGRLEGQNLVVEVSEIYCTKPGPEAGHRMDTMGYEKMKAYDESRWKDLEPPK
ncbi:MAG: pyridoxamine 5'-phosphate oxidase family protein [Chloroflexi bacterium]|nr:pyridoxamine 5'-phosphate oxidase family protein [Chloroflexota bacterium]